MEANDIGGGFDGYLDDTVFIKGLPETVTEELLAKHFASVGSVKVSHSHCFVVSCLSFRGTVVILQPLYRSTSSRQHQSCDVCLDVKSEDTHTQHVSSFCS